MHEHVREELIGLETVSLKRIVHGEVSADDIIIALRMTGKPEATPEIGFWSDSPGQKNKNVNNDEILYYRGQS
jgi:hypothetical protein